MKNTPVSTIVTTLIAILPLTAHGADTPSPGGTLLDEVVVTAGRSAETLRTVTAHVSIIDAAEIRQSTSRTVADLLAEQGLGHIHRYPASLSSVGVRGFRTDTHGNDLQGKVLVLLDGRRAGTGNLAKMLTKNVERVEIIRGPGAVQYGSAGMGGVINVITRQGRDNSLFVESGAGSFGHREGNLGGTVKLDKFDFSGSLGHARRDSYQTGAGDPYPNSGVGGETGFSSNLGYSFSERHRLGLIVTGVDIDGAGSPDYFNRPDQDDSTDKRNISLDLNYRGKSAGGGQWLVRAFLGRDENSWSDPTSSDPSGYDDGIASSNSSDQHGAQAQYSATWGTSTLTTGLDLLHYRVENSWNPKESSYLNPALFVLGHTTVFQYLTVSGGLRQDWYRVEMEEPKGNSENQKQLIPQIGVALALMPQLKLRAQYAQAFMLPSADQLAADYQSFAGRVRGNPELLPESSATWEVGLDGEAGGVRASLGYFATDYEDKIVIHYLADGSTTWTNLGEATLKGLEAEISADLGAPLGLSWEIRPSLGLTHLTTFRDESSGEDLLYTSATELATALVVGDGKDNFVRINARYTGSQEVQDWESAGYPTPVVELDPFTVVDLAASWRFYENAGSGAWILRAELRNLGDEDYAYVKGYPMPGRSLFVGLRWEF